MCAAKLRGLTWGHRRAIDPLAPLGAAFAHEHPGVTVEWAVRPLSDFEHQPIADIASRFDLMIIDHPFCGDIAASGALMPLDAYLPDLLGASSDELYVGPSLASYRYAGHVWAAPIDAAGPHAAYRPDLLGDEPLPTRWADAVALGRRLAGRGVRLATPVVSPHAFATVASLMANLGRPIASDPDAPFAFDREAMATAMEALDEVLALSPPETLGWNAITIEEAMVARDDIVFTPSVYGYATYAETDQRAPLRFAPFCGLAAPFHAGAMLGGTGLAVSAATLAADAAIAFVRFCLSRKAQDTIIPQNHGQPARVTAWENGPNNIRFGGYYSAVRSTIEMAWIRPRWPGYTRFQAEAGRAIEAYCRRDIGRRDAINRIEGAGPAIFGRTP